MTLYQRLRDGFRVMEALSGFNARASGKSWKEVLKSQFHDVLEKFTDAAETSGLPGPEKKEAVLKLFADW